jgi:hypothetical protein
MTTPGQFAGRSLWRPAVIASILIVASGCAHQNHATPAVGQPTRVLVVAPVLNLSGSQDFDPLKVTDLIASEFVSYPGVSVIPVNLALAELARAGKTAVTSPDDAVTLAHVLGADATIVIAVTEYNPYSPPVVGLIMQWYSAHPQVRGTETERTTALREASGADSGLSEPQAVGPRWQVQRVFNAADEKLLKDVRQFASRRDGPKNPYGWRQYIKSQELYVRYCGWAMIRTMLMLDESNRATVEPDEAHS